MAPARDFNPPHFLGTAPDRRCGRFVQSLGRQLFDAPAGRRQRCVGLDRSPHACCGRLAGPLTPWQPHGMPSRPDNSSDADAIGCAHRRLPSRGRRKWPASLKRRDVYTIRACMPERPCRQVRLRWRLPRPRRPRRSHRARAGVLDLRRFFRCIRRAAGGTIRIRTDSWSSRPKLHHRNWTPSEPPPRIERSRTFATAITSGTTSGGNNTSLPSICPWKAELCSSSGRGGDPTTFFIDRNCSICVVDGRRELCEIESATLGCEPNSWTSNSPTRTSAASMKLSMRAGYCVI
jgi:hypothetical protein